MRPDVVDLNTFYSTRLGHVARRLLRHSIRAAWPDLRGNVVLGLGYPTPYLGLFREEAERVFAIVPASQGVMPWPLGRPRQVALAEEPELPLPDNSIDRILMIHALEHTEQLRPTLAEVWRILRPDGRLLAIVPNRRGLWARLEATPFGFGHPFSASQLSRLLRDNQFAPLNTGSSLYLPPSQARMVLRTTPLWQRVGRHMGRPFAGVVYAEASKNIFEARLVSQRRRARVFVPVAKPAVSTRSRRI
jgi:SAM-dependent methyltransferase